VGVNVYKPGDFNHDGVIDSTDIANFKAHLGLRGAISGYIAGGSTTVNGDYFTYDLNGAFATTVGSTSVEAVSVDWKDAEIFCQYAGLSYGDVNMDGSVNYADLNTLASNYGLTNKIWTDGKLSSVRINAPDANTVGLVDLVTEAANWPVASLGKPALSYNASGAPDLIPSATLDRAFAITSGGTISQIANTSSGTVNWGTASTWINGDNASIVPNSPGAIASLLNKATNDTTVNIDGNYTVGQLNFDNYFTFTLSGAGTLHLAGNNGTSAEVNTFAQSPVISAAVSLDSPTNITITYSTDTATFSGAISGMGSLNKLGAGAVLLTGANSYSGGTNVSTGTLQATTPASLPGYAAAGNVSVGGAGTLILNVGGITEWTRTGVDSLQAAATFAAGSYLGFDTTNAAGTATLASNLTGSIGILKQGPNTLQLTGTNSYSGLTNVSGGVLLASTPTALPGYTTTNSITVASGATAAVNVGGAGEWTSSQIDTLRGNLGLSSGSGIGIDTTDAPSGFTYGSVITGTGVGFSKMGPNTLTLTGNSTYNGSTSVLGGTLSLNFAGASSPLNILAPTSSLILANNGGLSVIGNASATNSQTLGGLTLNAGSAAIIAAASTTNPLLLSVGSITRNIGATVDFTDPAGTQSATNGIITTSSTSSSVLGGWATIGQSDWAGKSSSGDIIPLASYTNDTWSGSNNTTVTASSAPSINSSTNTLRFAATGSYTLILSGVNNIGTGGVLVAPAVGANNDTITGGTITGKTSTDLIVNQFDTSGSLEIDSVIADASSATGLTKSGGGLLILTGGNTYTGSTFVNAGTVNVSSGSLASTSYTIQAGAKLNVIALNALPINSTLSDNGSVTFGPNTASAGPASLTLSSLLIGPGGIVNLADPAVHSNRTVLSLSALAVAGGVNAWTGTLNIGGNDLILHNSSLATVTNLVASGFYGTSPWTGKGLTSSTAAADTSHLTAVGVILNNDGSGNALYGSSTTLGNFDRLSPSTSDVLVKYTYYGDANLDGKVDSSDYARIDGGFLSSGSLTGWFNGDSNYDGLVNGSDYTLIDNAFNTQSAALTNQIANPTAQFATTGAAAAVPEPATFGLFGLTVLGSLGLRRRKTTSVAI
jgi:fibronectin-binding autotransporter adhesin